ncbi:choice-of-anchor A family protein [Roseateles oligotrophus]|uniref:Choice-of-anchor A family protein n=1 Tax=Roseateles oligotrophus TaxID=1769250 RepID=A0ABT2YD39_9BURK|nr:choice-of-anchor A family protein [Roseateles oligotrophus]MCV2367954.1 choice-of-anchor A family protein [Roseateles oligotrophus]
MSRLASTGSSVSISNKGKRVTSSALANSQGLAVFDLSRFDKQIFSKGEFAFELNGANTVIFNVDEASLSFASNFLNGSATQLGGKAIWNFYNASSLNISNQFGGTILAPLAKLTHHSSIEGSVLVNQLDQRGKINLHKFTGDITSAVPEAQSSAMLLAGLVLVTRAVRRRPVQKTRA